MSSSATPQQLPTFGRKYQIQVSLPSASGESETVLTITDSAFEPEALRATFDIYMGAWQNLWTADICIYNLDQQATDQILSRPFRQGMNVTVSAGYQHGNYGVIWNGPVFQPLFDRENVIDYKITLHCILGLDKIKRNFVNTTFAAGIDQSDLLQKIADSCFNPIQVGTVSSNINKKTLPRGGVLFGNPDKYISQLADDNNMQWWLGPGGIDFGSPDEDTPVSSVDYVYSPSSGIIGVPQQTQDGVDFRVLLDPRLQIRKPLPVVKIDNSVIRQQKRQVGELFGLLDQDGEYIVIATRFIGDTRGNDWYTEIVGVTSVGGKLAMIKAGLQSNLNNGG